MVNNMGVIYDELGEKEKARSCFMEAMDFIPEGFDYPDPGVNLNNLDE
jgi:Flp pilus assembly protein TadD